MNPDMASRCVRCYGTREVCSGHPALAWGGRLTSAATAAGWCACSTADPCPDCTPGPLMTGSVVVALEPSTEPNPPLTAQAAACFIPKEIG